LYDFEEAVCASMAEALFYSSNPTIGAHVRHTLAYGLYLVIVGLYLAKPKKNLDFSTSMEQR
jgi:hypothetical protein